MKAKLFALAFLFCSTGLSVQAASLPTLTKNQTEIQNNSMIDLNQANAAQLTNSVKGIGKKRAEAIIKYREEHGQFKSIEDLSNVRGIGKQFVTRNLKELQQVFRVH